MVFLVAALLLFGVLTGTAAHLPLPATLAGAVVIAVWLAVFTVRERRRSTRATKGGSR